MQNEGVEKAERYSSGGLVVGVIGLVFVAIAIGYGLLDPEAGFAAWAYPFCLLLGVLIWAILIRPALRLHREELELRNALHTRWVPFALITSLEIGQVTVVQVGEAKYVGSGFGRTRRTIRHDKRATDDTPLEKRSTAWLIEDKLRRRMADGRDRVARDVGAGGEVRLAWAWPEIGALVVLAVVTVVLALVG
ncbi:hypothetical protein KVF89_18520 [Nocardioides carbamazepini]|uniref:hypothetical protein n=1 Tax=Nocardioides carbamazepini TaxID=2854259 RepID=UPI00214A0067|nr:hypothetical protein [Nocardioides carbamazepini]MCR1784544.1 hypothetical protein [Nocardioides carbamazepini]